MDIEFYQKLFLHLWRWSYVVFILQFEDRMCDPLKKTGSSVFCGELDLSWIQIMYSYSSGYADSYHLGRGWDWRWGFWSWVGIYLMALPLCSVANIALLRWGLVPSQSTSSWGLGLSPLCSLYMCGIPLSVPAPSPQRGVVFGQEGLVWTPGMGLGMSCGNPTTERDSQTKCSSVSFLICMSFISFFIALG